MKSSICEYCFEPFTYQNKGKERRFCSHEHYSLSLVGKLRAEWVTQICPTCGEEFTRKKSRVNRSNRTNSQRHCSSECARPTITAAHVKHDQVECKSCGESFQPRTNKDRLSEFCSQRCFGASNRAPQALLRKQEKAEPTSIERKIMDCLSEQGIEYEFQYSIYGSNGLKRYACDFAFPAAMLIVECDGNYWHSLKKSIASDKRKDKYLKQLGYTVLRFGETQINQDTAACVQAILCCL